MMKFCALFLVCTALQGCSWDDWVFSSTRHKDFEQQLHALMKSFEVQAKDMEQVKLLLPQLVQVMDLQKSTIDEQKKRIQGLEKKVYHLQRSLEGLDANY